MWFFVVIFAFFGTWIVATAALQRDDGDWVTSVMMGLAFAMFFPLTWMGFGIRYLAQRVIRFMDEVEERE